jgi:hypothetical protein
MNGTTVTRTHLLAFAALLMMILLASAFVLRVPLTKMSEAIYVRIKQQVADGQRIAQREALERAIAKDLRAATEALRQLNASVSTLNQDVQDAIGTPLQSAVVHAPTALRRAFLSSASFRKPWKDLVNLALALPKLDAMSSTTTDIATRLSGHAVDESDRQRLAELMTVIQSWKAWIDYINASSVSRLRTLDSHPTAQTMQVDERRSSR